MEKVAIQLLACFTISYLLQYFINKHNVNRNSRVPPIHPAGAMFIGIGLVFLVYIAITFHKIPASNQDIAFALTIIVFCILVLGGIKIWANDVVFLNSYTRISKIPAG